MKTNKKNLNPLTLRRAVLILALLTGLSATKGQLRAQGFGGGGFGGGGGGGNNAAARSGSRSTTTYPSSTQMGTATVSVNPETRQVFVITDDDTAQYVKQVVTDLDRPTPQVLIKCIFLEAIHTKDLDVGVDGTYKHTISTSASDQLNGTGVASTAFGAVTGGGSYVFDSLTKDLTVTLTALAKAGKTEILSRPSILARNNQPATISLGQQVPLISSTRFDTFGNQINSVTYQNVGIILQVTPFITSAGMVEMVVAPQTSELADRSQWVPISGGSTNNGGSPVSAPVINSRSADTVVIVPDGQTVVIGGLMQSQRLTSENKVPILGDIPLLGMLFRHKVTNNGKTELLIFLTPHIINQPSELAAYSEGEKSRSQMIPKSFSEQELNRFLNDLSAPDKATDNKKKK